MKHFIKKCFLIVTVAFVLIWLISFCKCEIYTYLYSTEFENFSCDEAEFAGNLRILSYSDEYAKVYYFDVRSDLVTFIKRGGQWKLSSHRVVSDGKGDVDRLFIWPYFWHYIIV